MARIAVVVQQRGDTDREAITDLKSRLARLRLRGLHCDLAFVCAWTDPAAALEQLRRLAETGGALAAWLVIDGGGGPLAGWASRAHGAPVVLVAGGIGGRGDIGDRGPEVMFGMAEVADVRSGLDFCARVAAWPDSEALRAIHDADGRAAADASESRSSLGRGGAPGSPAPGARSPAVDPGVPPPPASVPPSIDSPGARDGELVVIYERELAAARTLSDAWKRPPGLPGDVPLDFSISLRRVAGRAREAAVAGGPDGAGQGRVTAHHLARGLIEEPDTAAAGLLSRLDLTSAPQPGPQSQSPDGVFSTHDELEALLPAAKAIARAEGRPCLTTLDVLGALVAARRDAPLFIDANGASPTPEEWVAALAVADAATEYPANFDVAASARAHSNLNPPNLSAISRISARPAALPPAPPKLSDGPALAVRPGAEAIPPDSSATGVSGPGVAAPRRATRLKIDGADPDFETVERVADRLLEGGLLGLPTDTMYALAADATNPRAVRRLTETLSRDVAARPVGVFIHSLSQLRHLAGSAAHPDIERALENLWPGPLTVVVPRHPSRFADLSGAAGLGVRIPDNYATLALLSMLGRPMAVAAAHDLGTAADAKSVAVGAGAGADLLLDTGGVVTRSKPTVIAVSPDGAWRLLSEGTMSIDRIATAIGRGATVSAR